MSLGGQVNCRLIDKAYRSENNRLFGHIPLYPTSKPLYQPKKPSLVEYYVKPPCIECKAVIGKWLDEGVKINLYVNDTNKKIRTFVRNMGISPLIIPSKVSVFKIANDELKKMGIVSLPHVKSKLRE